MNSAVSSPGDLAKPSAYELDRAGLEVELAALGEPRYRADQIWRWMYRRLATSFLEMTDLPASLRRRLEESFRLGAAETVKDEWSSDGLAEKRLLRLADGQEVEAVVMHYPEPGPQVHSDPAAGRWSACLSTQVGCAMGCSFCATGQMGLVRDLTRGEIVEQAVTVSRRLQDVGSRLANVVFMGMGEPLANWPGTWGAIETLTDPEGFGLSPRRITVSTVGLPAGIRRLARVEQPIRLAVSIHAPDNELRSRLVKVNDVYGLDVVLAACREYQAVKRQRVTIEYVLIRGVNDHPSQARRLVALLEGLQVFVNLIPLNPTSGSELRPSTPQAARAFQSALESAGLPVAIRMRRGLDILAGCGQLRSRTAGGWLGRSLARRESASGSTQHSARAEERK